MCQFDCMIGQEDWSVEEEARNWLKTGYRPGPMSADAHASQAERRANIQAIVLAVEDGSLKMPVESFWPDTVFDPKEVVTIRYAYMIQELVKALEAGGYNAAPTQLTQGCIYQIEDLDLGADFAGDPFFRDPACECGAEKCKSNIHSDWCPKCAK